MEEIWKTIEGFEDYQVSNFGRVKSLSRNVTGKNNSVRILKEKILKPGVDKLGYLMVILSDKNNKRNTTKVHQLVSIVFLNHKKSGHKLVVNHKDFNRQNNYLDNLEIVTQRENSNRKHIKSSSKYIGVFWDNSRGKWVSKIQINGKSKHLGCFNIEIEASNAYQNKLKEILCK